MTRVMLIDDDESVRDLVGLMLREHGYEVVTAFDGLDALERLAAGWRPDLIMLDWRMPRMGGADFLRDRRALEGVHNIPILILSASLTASTVVSQREGLPVIRKPFDIDELLGMITQLTQPSEQRAHA